MSDSFSDALLAWHDQHGRHDLPWQHPREPYRVWLSEIMLQQTQVRTVIPYFQRFLHRFPKLPALAEAPLDEVLAHWAGLGYYSRARNLHRCAQLCVSQHGGTLPNDQALLEALPGIGRSTAAAIRAQAYGEAAAILDGNVKRVLSRYHGIEQWPGLPAVTARLWELAERHTPRHRVADYTQAIMDLGAGVCRRSRPTCGDCPVTENCQARIQGRQADWPARAPRRNRPERHSFVLWALDRQGMSLFERRPPSGIWGGLWSLPEIPFEGEEPEPLSIAQSWCAARGFGLLDWMALPRFRHDFTHFRLHLHPIRLRVAPGSVVAESDQRWIAPGELESVGLPRPIERLFAGSAEIPPGG